MEVPENVILSEKSKNEKKKRKVTTTRTDDYKKIRAKKKRKIINNNYKLKPNGKLIHNYENDEQTSEDANIQKKKKPRGKFSKVQAQILDAISAQATECKLFVPLHKILNYINNYVDAKQNARPKVVIRAQITRLTNMKAIIQKRFSFRIKQDIF